MINRDELIAKAADEIKKLATCETPSDEKKDEKKDEESKNTKESEKEDGEKKDEKKEDKVVEKVAYAASNEVEYEMAKMYGYDVVYDETIAKTASDLLGVIDPVEQAKMYLTNAHLIQKEASMVAYEAEIQKAAAIKVLINHGLMSFDQAASLADLGNDEYLASIDYGSDAE